MNNVIFRKGNKFYFFNGKDDLPKKPNELNYSEILRVMRHLEHYEDLENSNRLITLPWAIGTKVFRIKTKKVFGITLKTTIDTCEFDLSMLNQVGKTIFGTKDSAEHFLEKTREVLQGGVVNNGKVLL